MLNRILAALLALVIAAPAVHARAPLPKPYKDGCSGGVSFFDRNVLHKVPVFENCCDSHDRAYGAGGTSDARQRADRGLLACIAATGRGAEAFVMWLAVRFAGQMFFPFDWRMGLKSDPSAAWWYGRGAAE